MAAYGLPAPPGPPMGGNADAFPAFPSAKVINIGGFLPIGNAAEAQRQQAAENPVNTFESQQSKPVITGLAGHIRQVYSVAATARQTVEGEMIEALYARRGQYTTEKLQSIQASNQPAIYMMVSSSKMRQVEALLRDVLMGSGADKPWTGSPTPEPDMPPEIVQEIVGALQGEIEQAMASGFQPTMQAAQERARQMRQEMDAMLMERAREAADRMERKMEDQQVEGGFLKALDAFITDLATFKTAFIAGPLTRNKPRLVWGQNGEVTTEDKLIPEWERIDPFDMYPSPWATDLNRGPLVRKHHMSRDDLSDLIGVDGFSEEAIREVLTRFGDNGIQERSSIEQSKALAEGKDTAYNQDSGLIDALQYWGSASGTMLRNWGMTEQEIPDETTQYQIEAWLIDDIIIKAVLNGDPLARRPYYGTSFQRVPGSVWGSSPYDLSKDCQDMCNAAARALAANMGISSGPQVAVLSNRIPSGEDITEMFPWKIWQFESDPMGSSAAPISFFQPQSNAPELMQVFERFSLLADEYTGIPRYMAGFNGGEGGAGRTASGISMMIGNATKTIKQVLTNIDTDVIVPLIERQHYYNMRFVDDPDLKRGDIRFHARGAMSLVTKETAQMRNNEFLQVALNSPVAQQIMGMEGVAELLRGATRNLDHNPNKIVPPIPVLKQRMAEQQMIAMQQAAMAPPEKKASGETLDNGAPTTDNFSPRPG